MDQKIKDAIADVINGLNVDEHGMSYTFYPLEVIESIAAAIAPLVEAGEPKDYPHSELFDHMANEHGLTLLDTELDDIIHIARGK